MTQILAETASISKMLDLLNWTLQTKVWNSFPHFPLQNPYIFPKNPLVSLFVS